ncbi:MAG TPA: GvpL/GvpF family gas vesicle protein [Myxococcaceae bacterium]|nr:GvpL/GvpF family gas vesicle protein [Myxococcaceae bacterium]
MTLWVYGWAKGSARELGRGAAEEPLRAVRLRPGLVAVAGEVARPLARSVAALRAHDRVVRRLTTRLGALVPARFGGAVDGPEALRDATAGREAALARALVELAGKVQMTARGVSTGTGPALPPLPRSPGARHLAKLARRLSVPELVAVRDDYGRFVHREVLERSETPPLAWTAYHLVDRRLLRAYRSAFRRAAARAGYEVVITGPHPPYAFVSEI